jgi:ribonuclease BN (tRNA processing enzyme)
MELTVLGSGSAVPHPRRSSSAFWLQSESGTLMLDLSASSLHRMAQENLDWAELDSIWISHFHLDHCGGLGPFLFACLAAPETEHRTKPLKIFGAPGLQSLVENLDSGGSKHLLLDQPFSVEIIEVEPLEKFEILENVEAVAYSTTHTPDSHAIHLSENESGFVFTSDTGFDEKLATLARHVDLLLMECSFVKDKRVEKHLELAEAINLIRRAEPKRAMLTHFYAEWDKMDFAAEVGKHKPGIEIIEAVDGLRISI